MARVCTSDIEAEMYSLLDQLAELNGCSLEDEFCEILSWAANDADCEDDRSGPFHEERDARLIEARLLADRKAHEGKAS